MRKKAKQFFIYLVCVVIFFVAGKCVVAQHSYQHTDSTAEEAVEAVDSAYSDIYDEDSETKEDSSRRAKANAFDLMDTVRNTGPDFRKLDDNFMKKFRSDDAFGYVKDGIPKPKEKVFKKRWISLGNLLLIVAIAAFIGFLIWYLAEKDILLFRKKSKSLATLATKEEDKDIFSINYNEAIQKALSDKNYRLAIRLQYLQMLRLLTDRGIISYQPDKTNFEYLLQVRPTSYYTDFFNVTRNYEYSWYGLFNVDETKYEQIKKSFIDLQKKIS